MGSMHAAEPSECFAELTGQVRLVQDGWDSLVAFVDDVWVARVPRTARTASRARAEIALLPVLADRLAVAVPEPVRTCDLHGSMLYRYIGGRPADQLGEQAAARRVGRSLAAVLAALHRTPLMEVRELGVEDLSGGRWGEQYRELCERFRARVLPFLPPAYGADGRWLLDRVAERTSDPGIADALVHRDLGPAHVLCVAGELNGIIDWTDACIGDRAIDLAWPLHGRPRPLASVLAAVLQVDSDVGERSRLYHQLGPWFEVEHGLENGRDDLVSSGLRGICDRMNDGERL